MCQHSRLPNLLVVGGVLRFESGSRKLIARMRCVFFWKRIFGMYGKLACSLLILDSMRNLLLVRSDNL